MGTTVIHKAFHDCEFASSSENEQSTNGQMNCVRDKVKATALTVVHVSTRAINMFLSHQRINESSSHYR
jgi:hypothetical protein